jgi:alkylmercury lyase
VVTPTGLRDVRPATAVVSMLLPRGPFSHDVVEMFCHFVHFFASEETGRRWIEEHPGAFLLSAAQAFEVARHSWPALFDAAVRHRQARYSTAAPRRS